MYADNARISHRQLFRQTVTALLGVYFFFIPMEESLRGRQGVLCLVSASLLYLFLIIYFIRIRNFFPGQRNTLGDCGEGFFCSFTFPGSGWPASASCF